MTSHGGGSDVITRSSVQLLSALRMWLDEDALACSVLVSLPAGANRKPLENVMLAARSDGHRGATVRNVKDVLRKAFDYGITIRLNEHAAMVSWSPTPEQRNIVELCWQNYISAGDKQQDTSKRRN